MKREQVIKTLSPILIISCLYGCSSSSLSDEVSPSISSEESLVPSSSEEPSSSSLSDEASAYLNLPTMKGLELYCFEEEGEWKTALMEGTNRLKTVEEVDAFVGISVGKMKEVLSTYGDDILPSVSTFAVSRPAKALELSGGAPEYYIDELNAIETELGLTLTKEIGLYSLLGWIEELGSKEITRIYKKYEFGDIAPSFSHLESTYETRDETAIEKFSASLLTSTLESEPYEFIYGGSGESYRVEFSDGTLAWYQLNNDYFQDDQLYKFISKPSLPGLEFANYGFLSNLKYGLEAYYGDELLDIDLSFVTEMEFVLEEDEVAQDPGYLGYEVRYGDEKLTFLDADTFEIAGTNLEQTRYSIVNGVTANFL